MRSRAVLIATLFLLACRTAPARRAEPAVQDASVEATVQYLITAAATDFRTHGPKASRISDVRFGELTDSDGEKRFMLCGRLLTARAGGQPAWTSFMTIRTSSYEQWIGERETELCQRPSVVWYKGDLSSALQSRLDSMP